MNLSDLDVNVKKGSFVVIVGATGSGKSSLLGALIGEMIHLPEKVIVETSKNYDRLLTDGELRYLEDHLLKLDLEGTSPV